MGHPQMFDDDDPVLAQVRQICLALPGAAEKISHGRPAFFTRKVFAYYGGSTRIDGAWHAHDTSILIVPGPEDAEALAQDERCWVPAYLGAHGWLGLDLTGPIDWAEVAELVEVSYRQTAPTRVIAELDATDG